MAGSIEAKEKKRCALQDEIDRSKSQAERNKLGQFSTPTRLARDVLRFGLKLLPESEPIRFLDPAIGTGSFYSALREELQNRDVDWSRGFEIDPIYGKPAQELWETENLRITIGDFTAQGTPKSEREKANLLICNPPYVRHHHLTGEEKIQLKKSASSIASMKLSGLAGLYTYFMAIAHGWMCKGGIAGWLIPSEFMDVNYGKSLKAYLLRDVTLLSIHRFDPHDVQFADALVSSAVVWFKNEKPPAGHSVEFSFGGTMAAPKLSRKVSVQSLELTEKWTRFPANDFEEQHEGYRLGDLFSIKRGLATGDNNFFILDEGKVRSLGLPQKFLRPILPSTRYIKSDEINADEAGVPLLDRRLFLLDCDLPEDEVKRDFPRLWAYLQTGMETVAPRYLCRSRRYWYAQERRAAAPIVCTYIGRSDHEGRPFRFLLNKSKATATNVYLCLYPKPLIEDRLRQQPGALRSMWQALNGIGKDILLRNGRVYGGGMHKLEPKELANVPADELAALVGLTPENLQMQLDLNR